LAAQEAVERGLNCVRLQLQGVDAAQQRVSVFHQDPHSTGIALQALLNAIRRLVQAKIRDQVELIERPAGRLASCFVAQQCQIVAHDIIVADQAFYIAEIREGLVRERLEVLGESSAQLLAQLARDVFQLDLLERAYVERILGCSFDPGGNKDQQRPRFGVAQLNQARGRHLPGGLRLLPWPQQQDDVGAGVVGVEVCAELLHDRLRQVADPQAVTWPGIGKTPGDNLPCSIGQHAAELIGGQRLQRHRATSVSMG